MKNFLINSIFALFLIGCVNSNEITPTKNTKFVDANLTKDTKSIDTNLTKNAKSIDTNLTRDAKSIDINSTKDNKSIDINSTRDTKSIDTNLTKDAKSIDTNLTKDSKSINTNSTKNSIKELYRNSIQFIKNKEYHKAYSILQKLTKRCSLEEEKICAKAFYNKALLEEKEKKYDDAVKNYEEAILTYNLEDKNGNIFEKIYSLNINNDRENLNIFNKLKDKYKNNDKFNYYLGVLYLKNNNKKDAKKFILKAKNLGNINAENLWFEYELYKY